MAGPFHNNIRSTCGTGAGTGAYTPNAAATGSLSWSTVPAGLTCLVRYDDGATDWELRYGYWNGTTITRPTNGFVASSSGSGLSLSSSATAELIIDAAEVNPHLGGNYFSLMETIPGANTITSLGAVNTNLGTPSAKTLAATNYLTEQPGHIFTSLTTASAAAGVHMGTSPRCVFSTAAGRGGGEFACRFGASQLPTAPRLWAGFETAINSSAADPSTYTNIAMFAKDQTDTNIQLMTNDAAGAATKTDTGIALVANAYYYSRVWFDQGGAKVYGLLIRLDTGDVWYGSHNSNLPANGSLLIPALYGSLNGTNTGTAIVMHIGTMVVRTGG